LGVIFSHPIMANLKRNIIFSLENRKKDGIPIIDNVPIRMRVIFSNNRIDFSTGYRIDVAKWDFEKQKVKNGCTNKLKQSASDINSDLQKYYTQIQDIFKIFETKNINPSVELLKKEFVELNKSNSNDSKKSLKNDFMVVYDEFKNVNGRQKNWAKSTLQKFESVKVHLSTFKSDLTFEYFDENGLNNYILYLGEKKKMRNTSVLKQLGFLKWFLRWAYEKNYNPSNAFEKFKPNIKIVPKKVIFLTPDELKSLREFIIPENKQYLERVRDVFIFCCYSSLRYSDVYILKKSDVKNNHFEITTVKTGDSLFIDLNNYTTAILNKYKDVHYEDDKALPVISNQKMNDYIKELAELVGLNEPIHETYYIGAKRIDTVTPKYELLSTHAGRRTFICYALSIGIPIQIVMKWTGHSDYKSMKPYIDVVNELKANEMKKFNLT
jgi:integrase